MLWLRNMVGLLRWLKTNWRDIHVTLHPPRAACFLLFCVWGFILSYPFHWDRFIISLLTAHFYLQWSAYALDELRGRHCGTRFSNKFLKWRAALGLVFATIIAFYLAATISWWLLLWWIAGALIVVLYNFEVLGFHHRITFSFSWGFYPVIAHYFINSLSLDIIPVMWGIVAAIFAYFHIVTYGNFGCRVNSCIEFRQGEDMECHGQKCQVRRQMPWEVHKLQKKIANLQVWMLVAVTIAMLVWRVS